MKTTVWVLCETCQGWRAEAFEHGEGCLPSIYKGLTNPFEISIRRKKDAVNRRKKAQRRTGPDPSLDTLYVRDRATCWICQRWVSRDDASRDHVVPRSRGGANALSNMRLAHKRCNQERGNIFNRW